MYITDPKELTPVELRGGIFLKRDDLFSLDGIIGGTKFRQCYYMMVTDYLVKAVHTGCSIHSPQAPIVAAVAKHLEIPCTVYYGGTTKESISKLDMPKLVMKYGATIDLSCKTGRQNVLQAIIWERADRLEEKVIRYGMNLISDYVLDLSTAYQVENIPNNVKNLVITCGSGISTIGILKGLQEFKKDNIEKIFLFGTAPNRLKKIQDKFKGNLLTERNKFLDRIHYCSLFHNPNFVYERKEYCEIDGLVLHPNYEAKAYRYFKDNFSGFHNESTLFWLIGGYPNV